MALSSKLPLGLDQGKLKHLRLLVEIDTQFVPGGKRLKIHGQELSSLPKELFTMTDLDVLDLSPERESCINYHVESLPFDIGKLANLKVLMLDTNSLYELPEEIGLLNKLEKISLSNNRLSNLPKSFGHLKSLKSLHLANNAFVAFPDAVCHLKNLVFLDISDNKLVMISGKINLLKNIETLLLYRNSIRRLPDNLCELTELRTLWLGENKLEKLPSKFGALKKLDWGVSHTISAAIDGNPLTFPPLYICKQGIKAIAHYFRVTDNLKKQVSD